MAPPKRFNLPWNRPHVNQQHPTRAKECNTVVRYSFKFQTPKCVTAVRNVAVIEHYQQLNYRNG